MSFLNTVGNAALNGMQGYGAQARRPMTPGWNGQQPAPGVAPQQAGQPRDKGMLMQYLRRKINPVSGASPADAGLPQDGMQIPMGTPPPVGAGPSMPPPENAYQSPFPMKPPVTDGEDPSQNPDAQRGPGGMQFAQGGVVNRPTTAIIGEDGPEMVVPLSGRPDAKVSPRNLPGMQMQYGRR